MVYTKPTRAKEKKKRYKRLTIGNTDKFKNYNSVSNEKLNKQIPINSSNVFDIYKKVANSLNKGKPPKGNYRYDNFASMNADKNTLESTIVDLVEMGINLTYHVVANDVSDKMLNALSKGAGNNAVMYSLQETAYDVNLIQKTHEATKVIFDVALIVPDMGTHKLIKVLYPYKTNIDEVYIDIPPLKTSEIEYGNDLISNLRKQYYYLGTGDNLWHCYTKNKYNIYKDLERPFSDWGTYITMVCTNDVEKKLLDEMVAKGK